MTGQSDLVAERALVGNVLQHPEHVTDVLTVTAPEDFYSPANGMVLTAVANLHQRGADIDARTVWAELERLGAPVQQADLMTLLIRAPVGWKTHAERVAELAYRRRLAILGHALEESANDPTEDPQAIEDQHRQALALVGRPKASLPDDLRTVDAIADEPNEATPWVIPGLIRSGWRVVIVGAEGAGKSWLISQLAIAAAQGVHPFTSERITPAVALIVDCENPRDALTTRFRSLRQAARSLTDDYDTARMFVHHRPAGIDLRRRRDAAELETVVATLRPTLVTLGPLYKAYRRKPGEQDEEAVLAVQAVLDDLRSRYGFALVLEHHAPHGEGKREMRPFGSSVWLRWPEFGIGLDPQDLQSKVLELTRWRGDRAAARWPWRLVRGDANHPWPWKALWQSEASR